VRLGIFGGTFDPVHYGHLLLAETFREELRLDEVRFVPAAVPPHKQGDEIAEGDKRVEMLKLAVGGHPAFRVDTSELARGGVSYTVDSLRRLREELPESEIFFLMGGDSLAEFLTWKEPGEILKLATPVVARRGSDAPLDWSHLRAVATDERLAEIEKSQFVTPLIEVSSTDIRRRRATGRSIRYRLPRAVEEYVLSQKLYDQPRAGGG
jgi:nicotinate-nucleotide adenylyltransferase